MADLREMDEAELRARVRKLLAEAHPERTDSITFRRKQFEHGLALVHFPEGHGGLGISPKQQLTVLDEIQKHSKVVHHDPPAGTIGIGMGMPTVLTYGSEKQKKYHLPRIFSGEDIWCQMFSEPSAGSDVAGLASRAVSDGDHWVVNGQKVWTSVAHLSSWGMLVVRTNPDVPKHDGLSYFILDMKTPGVTVRPLYQITAEAEFNEVFFDNVRIPHENMLGKEGQGWRVAITTLMNERVAIGSGGAGGGFRRLLDLARRSRRNGRPAIEDSAVRQRLADFYVTSKGLQYTGYRTLSAILRGATPGPEGSIGKAIGAPLGQQMAAFAVELQGASGGLLDRDAVGDDVMWQEMYLASPGIRIAGGTDEVLRNIIAERVLGLPPEIRLDKDKPFRDVPTGK